MIYVGIVESIKDEDVSGLYGRKKVDIKTQEKIKGYTDYIEVIKVIDAIFPLMRVYSKIGLYAIETWQSWYLRELQLVAPINTDDNVKKLIIHNDTLLNNYRTQDKILYGLFDNYRGRYRVFSKIMKSGGGSTLIILGRESANKLYKHFGEKGLFSNGLYTLHPKDNNTLVPLNNANEVIKSFILEEIVQCFEALGAKRILIEDYTDIELKSKASKSKIDASGEYKNRAQILRKKEFGKGIFDPTRAQKDKLFLYDFPNIISIVKARIHGNQLVEEFTENINLNVGLDINVLTIFKANIGFNYNRKWHFLVEFYDKNNIS